MTINEYQKLALRTNPVLENKSLQGIIHGVMGMNGEAGEAIDIVKKCMYQGHELDSHHLALELGDVAWYVAACADALGYDFETILQMNIEKLKARYPDGFDSERSKHRREGDI